MRLVSETGASNRRALTPLLRSRRFGAQVVPKVQGAIPKREKKKKEPMGAHSWGWGDSMVKAEWLSSVAWSQAVHPKLAGPQGVPLATLPAC